MSQTKISPTELKNNLSYYSGSESFFKHSLGKFLYTDGVQYLAESAECYWLLDIIGSLSVHPDKFVEREDFICINLVVKSGTTKAVFTADDGNDNILYVQEIPFTDFPLSEIRLFYCNGTLLLPSEY